MTALYIIIGILIGLVVPLIKPARPKRTTLPPQTEDLGYKILLSRNESMLELEQLHEDALYFKKYEERTLEYKREYLRDQRKITKLVSARTPKDTISEGDIVEAGPDYRKYLDIWYKIMGNEEPLSMEDFIIQTRNPDICFSLDLRNPMMGIYNIHHEASAKYLTEGSLSKEFQKKWGFA